MSRQSTGIFIGIVLPATLLALSSNVLSQPAPQSAVAAIQQASNGQLKAAKGKYFNKDCNQQIEYDAEAIDLNGDSQLEVFTRHYGTCMGGGAGVSMNLYIKSKSGKWAEQFGVPGDYKILKTKNKGFPDIQITGPGTCFPVWRWNGQMYDLFKKCKVM